MSRSVASARGVSLSRRAERSLEDLDPRLRGRIRDALRALADDPLLGKKLKGALEGLRSLRIGTFRILYRFDSRWIEVVDVDDRKDVYR